MKKKGKSLLMLTLILTVCMTCGLVATGCNKGNENVIKLDGDFAATYEYTAKEIELPTAHVENGNGEMVSYDVVYKLYTSDGKVTESEYSTFNLDVGEYRLVYSFEETTLEKTFSVVDTTAPVITFTGVVGSQFLQDLTNGTGSLPTTDVTDLSEDKGMDIDRKLTFVGSDKQEKEVSYNQMTMSYTATEFGTFTYTVKATDKYGNSATNSISWKIKDHNWQPTANKAGYLADFDEEGYINYIEPGYVDQYYMITDITENYVEEFEGEKGAVKIVMGFNHAPDYGGYNSLLLRLPTASHFTREQANGKYIAIRMYIEDDLDGLLSSNMIWGGNNMAIQGDSVTKCSKWVQQGLKIGEWFTMYISAGALDFYDNDTKLCEQVQICFSDAASLNGTNEHMTLYVGGISLTDKLPAASGLKIENKKAVWNAVEGATSYLVEMNGSTKKITETSIALDGTKGYVKVTPFVDGITKIDGDFAVISYGLDSNGHLALFDDDIYKALVDNVTSDVYYQYSKSEKTLTADGLQMKLSPNGVLGAYNGFRLHLLETLDGTKSEYLIIRMKFDQEKYKTMYVKDGNGTTIASTNLEEKSGNFFDWKIDLSGYNKTTDVLEFFFGPADSSGAVADGLEVVLQDVKVATYLKKPVLVDDRANKTISWEAVENAAGYIVCVNGQEQEMITTTSFNYASVKYGTITVKAVGRSEKLVDSEYTDEYYFDVRLDNEALTGFALNGTTITWTNIANKTKYEVKIGDRTIDSTTASFDRKDYADQDTIRIRAVGTDDYRDTAWVELKIIDNALYIVKGEISIASNNVGWGNNALIQINGLPLNAFEGDAGAGSPAGVYGALTLGGNGVTVSASFFGNDNKTFMITNLGDATDKELVIPAGTIFYQNGSAYTVREDVSLWYFSDTWCAYEGEFELKKTGWGTTGIIQLGEVEIPGFTSFTEGETPVGVVGGNMILGENTLGGITAKYFNSNILMFTGSFAEGEILTFKKGLMIYNKDTKTAYTLKADFNVVFAGDNWNVIKGSADLSNIGWGNNSLFQIGQVEIDVDPDGQEDGYTTNNLTVPGGIAHNGTAINMSLKYFNDKKILMFQNGNFSKGDIVSIAKNSVICQPSTKRAYVVEKDVYLIYNGGAEAGSWGILEISGSIEVTGTASSSTEKKIDLTVAGLSDGTLDCSLVTVTTGGERVEVTATCSNGVLSVSGEFGTTFTLKSGSVFKLGEQYYVFTGADVSLIYQSGSWGAIAGTFTITSSGYATDGLIQISQSFDLTEGEFSTAGVNATLNGSAYTLSKIYYHASAGVLQLETSGHTLVKGDALTLKKGSIFAKDGKFFELTADVDFVAFEKADGSVEWSYAKLFNIEKVHWGADWVLQVVADWGVDPAKGDNNLAVDYSGATIEVSANVTITTVVYQAGTTKLQPQFSGVKAGDTVKFVKGSVFVFEGVKYVLTEDFTATWDGSNWN